jgi:hypothetical protein
MADSSDRPKRTRPAPRREPERGSDEFEAALTRIWSHHAETITAVTHSVTGEGFITSIIFGKKQVKIRLPGRVEYRLLCNAVLSHIAILGQRVPRHIYIAFGGEEYSNKGVEDDIKRLALPKKAPELWPGKWHSREELPDFFRRVWGKFLPVGLDMPTIKDLDETLYNAVRTHRRDGLPWPEDLKLPNREEKLKQNLAAFEAGKSATLSDKDLIAVIRKRQRDQAATPRRDQAQPPIERQAKLNHG